MRRSCRRPSAEVRNELGDGVGGDHRIRIDAHVNFLRQAIEGEVQCGGLASVGFGKNLDAARGYFGSISFASHFGADFYGLPRHEERITLIKESWKPAATYEFGGGAVVPYRAGEDITWRLAPGTST